MKVSFEFTTENENRSTMLLVAEFCNALAGNVARPILSPAVEPETEKQPIKTVAEIITEERAKTASMRAKAPVVEEPEQISEEATAVEKPKQKSRKNAEAVAKRTEEKEAAEKLEAERQAETDRLTAEAAKLEAKRVAEEAAKEAAAKEEAAKEAAAKEAAAPEQTPLTIKDCRDLAMQALNKQRKDLIQEAFAKVGCPNFPTLEKKPEMFSTFMEHIKSGLNE